MLIERFNRESTKSATSTQRSKSAMTTTMTTEKKKLTSSVRATDKSGAKHAKDLFIENNSTLLLNNRMSKQSQKNASLSLTLNHQEEKRLKILEKYLDKSYNLSDAKWLKEFIDVHKSLENINVKSNYLAESNTFSSVDGADDDDRLTSKLSLRSSELNKSSKCSHPAKNESSSMSVRSARTAQQRFTPSFSRTSYSINDTRLSDRDEREGLDYLESKKKATTKFKRDTKSAISYTSNPFRKEIEELNKSFKPFTISRISSMSTRLSVDFYNNRAKVSDGDDEATTSEEETTTTTRKSRDQVNFRLASSKLSVLLPDHFDASSTRPTTCSTFPCTLLNSYTSMLGRQNDRTREQLESVGFKDLTVRSSQLSKYSTWSSASASSRTNNNNKSTATTTSNDNQASLARKVYLEFVENKSIRRPLKSAGSTKSIVERLDDLNNKVKYCREQNAINMKSEDRNIRYGGPLPKKQLYRQLRLLNQFENFIF